MSETKLKLIVRTPREVVLEIEVQSVRLPTETGQVGVRPRVEALVLAVEPGLVRIRQDETILFTGTAGGLFRCDGRIASLLTPLAVVGETEADVAKGLEYALQQPNAELEARATLSRLQNSILRELRASRRDQLRTLGSAKK